MVLYYLTEANKNKRPFYTTAQVKQLEAMFSLKRYPTSTDKLQLAEVLNVSEKQVSVWFQNRRSKDKRKCEGVQVRRPMKVQQSAPQPAQPMPSSIQYPVIQTAAYNSWYQNPQIMPGGITPLFVFPINVQSFAIAAPTPKSEGNVQEPGSQVQQTVGMMEKMAL